MKALLLASRPKTLPAAIVPVWLATALAYHLTGEWSLTLLLATLGATVCIQVATNLFNDAIDARKGSDTERRLGPKRVTASGLVAEKTVFIWAGVFLFLAALCAIPLITARGWIILAIGVPSLYLSYGYTGGPVPLAYRGLGETFVFLFFGLVATAGTYFVQTGEWSAQAALLGAVVGWLSCLLIAINNLRDVEEDESTGKRTLAVRLGGRLYRRIMIMMGAHCSLAILAVWYWFDLLVGVEIAFIILSWVLLNMVVLGKKPEKLNLYLALSGGLLVLFAVLFQMAVLIANGVL